MKFNNPMNMQKPMSLIQIASLVLPVILIIDFIIDSELDYAIVIIEIIIHSQIAHLLPANIVYHGFIILAYALDSSTSTIQLINFSNLEVIYNIIVNIICIISIFYITDHKKLTSRFSTIHFDTLFSHHKEVAKAFVSIP